LVDEEVNKMKNKYYGEMATKIQARWRGYHTRKYKHNFKARKQYLEVNSQNEIPFYKYIAGCLGTK